MEDNKRIEITEKDVLSFGKWWSQNKAVYEGLGIKKDIAHTIWDACADAVLAGLMKAIGK